MQSLSPSDISDLEQWENEGGQTATKNDFLRSFTPVKRGDIFEVKVGDFHYDNGTLYFEVEIKILALPNANQEKPYISSNHLSTG